MTVVKARHCAESIIFIDPLMTVPSTNLFFHVSNFFVVAIIINFYFTTAFLFGDPHLITLDRRSFTFNGIGEYVLVHTPAAKGFDVQARMEKPSSNVSGTVMTNIVMKLRDIPEIQVEAGSEQLNLYIGGIHRELVVGDAPIFITSSGILSTDTVGGIRSDESLALSEEMALVRIEDRTSLVVGFNGGESVVVSLRAGFLALSVTLPDSYKNTTSGLLGVFNGDPDDDFSNRNGTVLNVTAEQDIYEEFGLICKWNILIDILC